MKTFVGSCCELCEGVMKVPKKACEEAKEEVILDRLVFSTD
jgi:hypothetical protein